MSLCTPATCGMRFTRDYTCQDEKGRVVNEHYCAVKVKPETQVQECPLCWETVVTECRLANGQPGCPGTHYKTARCPVDGKCDLAIKPKDSPPQACYCKWISKTGACVLNDLQTRAGCGVAGKALTQWSCNPQGTCGPDQPPNQWNECIGPC
jgi:hypothetical protein